MTSGIKAFALLLLLCLPLTLSAVEPANSPAPDIIKLDVPLGTWIYGVWLDGKRIGTATATTSFAQELYTSTLDMTVRTNETIVTTSEITKETITYNPVSYFCSTTVILKDKVNRELITAEFQKETILLKRGNDAKTVTLKGDFVISGNKFTAKLLKSKFPVNTEMNAFAYDPTLDEDTLVSISEKVLGKEMVTLPKGKMELFHLVESFGPVKSIHSYIDAEGTTHKTTISMLNSTLELLLESRGVGKKK
jgi:hypothetical protein